MFDILLQVQPQINAHIETILPKLGVRLQAYILVTVHRAYNTDDPETLQEIVRALNRLEMPVIFPVHPRTRVCLEHYGLNWKDHVQLIDPVGYLDMLALESAAYRIVTDSGGVQKEAFLLGVPCVTLREETEWTETVEAGWNILAGYRHEEILNAIALTKSYQPRHNYFGEGNASIQIARSLSKLDIGK